MTEYKQTWTYNGMQTPYSIDCAYRVENEVQIVGIVANEGVNSEFDTFEERCLEELDHIKSIGREGAMLGTDGNNATISEDSDFANIVVTTELNPSESNIAMQIINGVALRMIQTLYPNTQAEEVGVNTSITINDLKA